MLMLADQIRSGEGTRKKDMARHWDTKLQEFDEDSERKNGSMALPSSQLYSTSHHVCFHSITAHPALNSNHRIGRFNSAIFVSLTANEYVVAAVSEDFIGGANWTLTGWDAPHRSIVAQMQQNASSYEKLDRSACINEYGIDYLSDRRHSLVVVSGQFSNPLLGILEWTYNAPLNSWVCGTDLESNMTLQTYSIDDYDCTTRVALGNDTWIIAGQPAQYCLSQKVEDRCRLQFAVPILIVVLCCNFAKLVCMLIMLWNFREPTFVTLGDALSGMLERLDPSTAGMCIANKKDFDNGAWPESEPNRWAVKRHFRFEAVGIRRFVFSNTA